jgi:hypothetical protein
MQYFLIILVFPLQVLFVDYGTSSRVKKNELLFMHQDFTVFPIQAIKASLVNLIPAGGRKRWSRETSIRFLELVRDKNLIAIVSSVDREVMFISTYFIAKYHWLSNLQTHKTIFFLRMNCPLRVF